MTINITVGSRNSPLAQAQVNEVLEEIRQHHPQLTFTPLFVETVGDKDQKTSLRALGKTDFFTKEVDDLLLNGSCRIAIHSAKDLPEPMPHGLSLIALTKGLDPADSIVIRSGVTLSTLASGAKIATSSIRREESVRKLRADFSFCDIRGTISQRLEKLNSGDVDGVVIAEAALIRLRLTHLNRIKLPGDTVPFQGQLAIVARSDDNEMEELFYCIDSRENVRRLRPGL